jgi:hypothetical protein
MTGVTIKVKQMHDKNCVQKCVTKMHDNVNVNGRYSGDTLAIAFGLNRSLWREDGTDLFKEAARMEAALQPFGAQPHWCHSLSVTPQASTVCQS